MARKRQRDGLTRNKERSSMSFFIVVMFFVVFGIIVVTEVLLMDERGGRGAGVLVQRGSILGVSHRRIIPDKPDYDDALQIDDYLNYRGGSAVIAPEPINNIENMLRDKKILAKMNRIDSLPVVGSDIEIQNQGSAGLRVLNDVELSKSLRNQAIPLDIENKLPRLNKSLPVTDAVWQSINGTRYKFLIYSAYYDRRKAQRAVRIIAATKTRNSDRVWCRFWFDPIQLDRRIPNGTFPAYPESRTIMGRIKVIRENWNLKYSACFIICPLHSSIVVPPTSVSLVSRLRHTPTNRLLVRNIQKDVEHIPFRLSVCVKPIHFNYNEVIPMLEFLELYGILGVEHFTFYNDTIGSNVDCLLRDYQRNNFNISVEVLPWKMDMVSQKEIRTEGLFAALNDCLYRNMYTSSHIALIDFDEFIIPKENKTLIELIKWLNTRPSRNTGSFSFQNAFFYLQWADDKSAIDKNNLIPAALRTLTKTRRKSKLHPHKQRSKYICRPELVIEAGNHFIWEFITGYGTMNVPPSIAILHHYRVCEFGGNDCVKTPSVIDRTAHKYKEILVDRVTKKYEQLEQKKICH